MGVTGLIKFVEAACEQGQVHMLKGCTVAIDSYCLLHKGAYSCSDKLVQGVKTTMFVDYIMKYVKMLKLHRVNIIMVFDGMAHVSKALTEKKRKESRTEAKARGAQLLADGRPNEAKKEFDKAVQISHEHALALMEACRSENVDCITSMYEADAQLAYLNKIGLATYVISEDSDLILFGCKKIVFKLSLNGSCVIFDSSKLHNCLGLSQEKFSFEKFRRIAIMSGCDYLDSLPGIGLVKASKFMMMTAERDMRKALYKIPSYLNMSKLNVTKEYIEGFLRAEAAFKYMFVYDPIKRKMVRLNELENAEDEEFCSQTGRELDEDNAYQLALGNINPRTFEVVADFDPRKVVQKKYNGKIEPHLSIWRCNINEFKTFAKAKPLRDLQTKITSFVPVNKVGDAKVRQIIEEENNVDESFNEEDLLSHYGIEYLSPKKNSISEDELLKENDNDIETPSRKNPFAKLKLTTSDESIKAEETSFMSKVVPKPRVVVSRFFQKQSEPAQQTEEMKQRAILNKEKLQREIDELETAKEEEPRENGEDDNDVSEVPDELKVQIKTAVIKPKPLTSSKSLGGKFSLGLKRKAPSISDTHPKLAKFGFTRSSQQ